MYASSEEHCDVHCLQPTLGSNPEPSQRFEMYSPGNFVEISPGRHDCLHAAQVVSTDLSGFVGRQGTLVLYWPAEQLAAESAGTTVPLDRELNLTAHPTHWSTTGLVSTP